MNDDLTHLGGERRGAMRYLEAVREHWLMVAVLVVVAVGAAAAYSFTAPKRYRATADILVSPITANDPTFVGLPGLLRETNVPNGAVITAARFVRAPAVADAVRRRLGLSMSRSELLAKVEARPLSQASIVAVTAEVDGARQAAELANAFAEALIAERTAIFQEGLRSILERLRAEVDRIPSAQRSGGEALALEQRIADLSSLVGTQDPTLTLVTPAVPPDSPSWPRPVLSIAVAFLAALLLGLGGAIALELVSPRVTREDELLLDHRLPLLTRVPKLREKVVRDYLARRGTLPEHVREAYRTLRVSLIRPENEATIPHTILVTSAQPSEGKTFTCINLAISLARAGRKVILVDGDLRRPMLATVFGATTNRNGFVRLLSGAAAPEEVLVNVAGYQGQLRLLLARWEPAAVVELLDLRRVQRVVDELKEHADVIVIDSPPLAEVADALNLARAAEAVIVVVRLGRTRRDRLIELRRMLSQHGVHPVGFVCIAREPRRGGYYYSSRERPQPSARGLLWRERGRELR